MKAEFYKNATSISKDDPKTESAETGGDAEVGEDDEA